MKYLKKFNEQEIRKSISFEEAKEKIKELYSEDEVIEMYDNEIFGGDWIDREQMKDEGYDDEYEYYRDYGRGEAEDVIINNIISDIKSIYKFDFDQYDDASSLVDFIKDEYDCLR